MKNGVLYFNDGRFFVVPHFDECELAGGTFRMYDVTPEVVLALKEFDVTKFEPARCSNCNMICLREQDDSVCGWYDGKEKE